MLYKSKSRPWNALELLSAIRTDSISISEYDKTQFEPILWNDLCSEYDAEHFCVMLENSDVHFSDEFVSFEKVWRRDEYNHYLGFRRIYHLFYNEPETSITNRLEVRKPDFADLNEFIQDEFSLCLILAYDEIATTHAYNEDIPFYRALGPEEFNDWIRFVKADEAIHYLNALRVVQVRHRDRLNEVEGVLQKILYTDLNNNDYKATFILDHKGPPFTPKMLQSCVNTIIDAVHRPVPTLGFY